MTIDIQAQMLIRKPASDVYDAFVDPSKTTKFWFTKSSGRLEPGARVRWDWEMYDAHADVFVKELERDKRILIEWSGPGPIVEWTFDARPDGTTYVTITNSGLPDIDSALDSKGEFTFLVAGAKFYLEHGVDPELVRDHVPSS